MKPALGAEHGVWKRSMSHRISLFDGASATSSNEAQDAETHFDQSRFVCCKNMAKSSDKVSSILALLLSPLSFQMPFGLLACNVFTLHVSSNMVTTSLTSSPSFPYRKMNEYSAAERNFLRGTWFYINFGWVWPLAGARGRYHRQRGFLSFLSALCLKHVSKSFL